MSVITVYTVTDKWQLELEMKVRNHGEGHYLGLLMVESAYYAKQALTHGK